MFIVNSRTINSQIYITKMMCNKNSKKLSLLIYVWHSSEIVKMRNKIV